MFYKANITEQGQDKQLGPLAAELFIHFDLYQHGLRVRETVYKWTGIHVSIGFARTKTLSKIANRVAKKSPRAQGVFILDGQDKIKSILSIPF